MKMKEPVDSFRNQRGSSLVAVFWLIGVLGLSILAATRFVALDSKWIVGLKCTAQARCLAETGMAIASHPEITQFDPLLTWVSEDGEEKYRAELTWEEGLIPLNHVLFHGRKDVVRRLFEQWGMDPQESASVVDAMVDWTDENDLTSLHGAEAPDYNDAGREGFPFNRPFETLDEVEWVMGMTRVAALKPSWREYFTLWSSGQIDLNEAHEEIISAAVDMNDSTQLSNFVQLRTGPDGIKGTDDDHRFSSVGEALALFGASPKPDHPLLTVKGATKRIVSTGIFHSFEVKISETRRGKDLLWRMEY
jgi:general secretion pathway protein K